MPELPHKFEKTRRGQIRVKYLCPGCNTKLENELAEAGAQDVCPDCGTRFQVPGIGKRKAVEAELKQKALLRKEALQRKEEERQQREAEERRRAEEAKLKREEEEAQAAKQLEAAADSKEHIVESEVQRVAAAPVTAPPPWAPPEPVMQDSPSFASDLPKAGGTAYPALELYALILRILGWIMVAFGAISFLFFALSVFFPGVTSEMTRTEAIGGWIAGCIMGMVVLFVHLLWALLFFVAAEFIKLALDARRDIATNVELTRLQLSSKNRQ
ncbi:MAG: hypothetical protein Aurels2KO_27960 [Aureliella sp.]